MRIDWVPSERLPELQAFVDEHWRRGHVLARDAELLRWQHRRCSDPELLSVLAAEEDGRLLAMLGWIEFDACVREDRVRGGWMTNWLVVPEARGRGLGRMLVERALDIEYDFVGALAANAATRHVLGRAGFTEVGMHRWVRVFDPQGLRELLGDRRISHTETQVPGGEGGDSFVGACRDADYLRWRYHEHPRFRYEVVEGLAAYRIETVEGAAASVMRIVDFLGDERLAARVAEAGERAGALFADFACTSARFGAPLEAAGFEREETTALPGRFQPLDFSDRPIVSCFWAAPRLGVDFMSGDLYVTRADSDLDRPN
jgi:GNAT superfamily N-acetyltransferase